MAERRFRGFWLGISCLATVACVGETPSGGTDPDGPSLTNAPLEARGADDDTSTGHHMEPGCRLGISRTAARSAAASSNVELAAYSPGGFGAGVDPSCKVALPNLEFEATLIEQTTADF